jgi:triosephosphate isomerase
VCPPYPWIVSIAQLVRGTSLVVGAQDLSAEPDGSFTGDVSASMLAPWCRFALVGHSERRTIHQETDELVTRKVRVAREHDLGVVLCVGETAEAREAGQAESTVRGQLETALVDLSIHDAATMTIAYEPVWAIGSGEAATIKDIESMSGTIRHWLVERHGAVADGIRILYGGSVSDSNVRELFNAPDVDGALVGGASLDQEKFRALIKAAVGSR